MTTPTSNDDRQPRFFSLNATYSIDPGQPVSALLNDVACLLDAGIGAFRADIAGMSDAQWAGLYMVEQAQAVMLQVAHLVNKAAKRGEA